VISFSQSLIRIEDELGDVARYAGKSVIRKSA